MIRWALFIVFIQSIFVESVSKRRINATNFPRKSNKLTHILYREQAERKRNSSITPDGDKPSHLKDNSYNEIKDQEDLESFQIMDAINYDTKSNIERGNFVISSQIIVYSNLHYKMNLFRILLFKLIQLLAIVINCSSRIFL